MVSTNPPCARNVEVHNRCPQTPKLRRTASYARVVGHMRRARSSLLGCGQEFFASQYSYGVITDTPQPTWMLLRRDGNNVCSSETSQHITGHEQSVAIAILLLANTMPELDGDSNARNQVIHTITEYAVLSSPVSQRRKSAHTSMLQNDHSRALAFLSLRAWGFLVLSASRHERDKRVHHSASAGPGRSPCVVLWALNVVTFGKYPRGDVWT